MSSVALHTGPGSAVPPEVRSVLSRVRGKLRGYVFIEGLCLAVVIVAALFWISLGMDWAYFRVRRLELPVWFRQVFVFATVGLFVAAILVWVVFRMTRTMREKALALVLERRFPDLNDRLITAVELEQSTTGKESDLTREMLNRTIREARDETKSLPVSAVFDRGPLSRAAVFAAVLVGSIVVFGVANADAMKRWAAGFLGWEFEYWDRENDLVARVVPLATREPRDFKGDEQVYKHPRGSDLIIEVSARRGELPQSVELSYEKDDDRGDADLNMQLVGGKVFRTRVKNLRDSLKFHIVGGDYTNRVPYRVEVVDPPEVKQMTLVCDHPDYTGFDFDPAKVTRVLKTGAADVPIGTVVIAKGRANKGIQGVRVETDYYVLNLRRDGATITGRDVKLALPDGSTQTVRALKQPRELSANDVAGFWADSDTFAVPFVVYDAKTTADAVVRMKSDPISAFALPEISSKPVRFYLHDDDEILARDPYRLTVKGKLDEAPALIVDRAGIRDKITRFATIPMAGQITDDFGVEHAYFEYMVLPAGTKVTQALLAKGEWKIAGWEVPPRRRADVPAEAYPLISIYQTYGLDPWLGPGPRDFKLGPLADPKQPYAEPPTEKFPAKILDLKEGMKVVLRVYSADGNDLYGPGITRSEPKTFDVIPASQLILEILKDEMAQVQQFQGIVEKMERVEETLKIARGSMQKAISLRAKKDRTEDDRNALEKANIDFEQVVDTGSHNMSTSRADSNTVENVFRTLIWEMRNNELDQGIYKKSHDYIAQELMAMFVDINGDRKKRLETNDPTGLFENASLALDRLKLAQRKAKNSGADSPYDPTGEYDKALDAVVDLNSRLRETLKKLQELVQFQQLIRQMLLMMDTMRGIITDTEKAQREKIFGPGKN